MVLVNIFINRQSDWFFFFYKKVFKCGFLKKNKTLFKNQIANSFSKNCVFRFKEIEWKLTYMYACELIY